MNETPRILGTPAADRSGSLGSVALLAITFGSGLGLLEYPLRLLRRGLVNRWMGVGPDALWMGPLVYVMVFLVMVAVLHGLLRLTRFRRASLPIIAAVLVFTSVSLALYLFEGALHKVTIVLVAAGTARLAFGPLSRAWPGFRYRATAVAVAALLIAAVGVTIRKRVGVAAAQASLAARPTATADAPNVLLLILDTVRAASLSLYGHYRPTTPALERLARRGVTFERAYSTAPWTLPAHASVFTGRHPHEFQADWWQPLQHRWPTLGEVLQDAGYATAGFVANRVNCAAESGLARGFDTYADHGITLGEAVRGTSLGRLLSANRIVRRVVGTEEIAGRKRGARVNDEALGWIRAQGDRPWFAFLNYFDAHRPYEPGPGFAGRFGSTVPGPGVLGRLWNRGRPLAGRRPFDGDTARMLAAYEESIAELDSLIGVLLDSLPAGRRTIIIVTSDHGEEFGEHGWFEHGLSLYPMALQIPLIVVDGKQVPADVRLPEVASLRDLAATITDLTGVNDGDRLGGRSLRRHWEQQTEAELALAALSWVPDAPEKAPAKLGDSRSLITGSREFIWLGDSTGELLDLDSVPAGTIVASRIDPYSGEAEWYARTLRRLVPDSLWEKPKPTGFSGGPNRGERPRVAMEGPR